MNMSTRDRLMRKVSVDAQSGCWIFTGSLNACGYGTAWSDRGKVELVHRILYRLDVGEIPASLELDHLCRNRACCNPAHLEPVPHKVNTGRGRVAESNRLRGEATTHCVRGHEYTPENTYLRPGRRHRECRTCIRVRRQAEKEFAA